MAEQSQQTQWQGQQAESSHLDPQIWKQGQWGTCLYILKAHFL